MGGETVAKLERSPVVGTTVQVFRDHPDWDRYEKWWMLRASLLAELYVCTYKLATDPDDPEYPIRPDRQLDQIEAENPGCVLVY